MKVHAQIENVHNTGMLVCVCIAECRRPFQVLSTIETPLRDRAQA
jgi:hypothetical protein